MKKLQGIEKSGIFDLDFSRLFVSLLIFTLMLKNHQLHLLEKDA